MFTIPDKSSNFIAAGHLGLGRLATKPELMIHYLVLTNRDVDL